MWDIIGSLKAVGEGLSQGLTNAITVLLPLLALMSLSFGAGWLGAGMADVRADLQTELSEARTELDEAKEQIAGLQETVRDLQRPNSDTVQLDSTTVRQ